MINSANTRIGVGIVGASADRGWGGIAHVPALRALDAFQIRAVSTTRMESANATASRLGADLAFDTHQALVVRPEVDLVVVAVKVPDGWPDAGARATLREVFGLAADAGLAGERDA